MLTSLQALLRLASLRWLGVFVCALATLLATTNTASALEPAQTKTRVWGFDFAEHNSVGLFRAASSGKHQGNCSARTEAASGSLLAARAGAGAWKLGGFKSAEKWASQMAKRGWSPEQISEAVQKGERFAAENLVNKGNAATRFVNPGTGRSVVIDDVTKEVIHVGGDGFKY